MYIFNHRFVSILLLIVGFNVTHVIQAEELALKKAVQLGVTVAKPASEVYAQLPALPRGCGFILKAVEPNGSAGKAGLKPMDVIWKMDGQLLINEGQLATLLSLYKSGDEVKLDCFQSGQVKQLVMKLYSTESDSRTAENQAAVFPFPHNSSISMHVVSYEDKSATITDDNGTATLKFNHGKPWLVILTPEGEESFRAVVDDSLDLSEVPASWRAKLPMLQRSLKVSSSLRKLPRVRRVPNPKPELVDGAAR